LLIDSNDKLATSPSLLKEYYFSGHTWIHNLNMQINSQLAGLWKKYGRYLLAAILAIYSLPSLFTNPPGKHLEDSWKRGLNMAVKNRFTFGTDVVFAYGPLGFLSTRCGLFINPVFFVIGDLFLFIGFYYVFVRILRQYKGWFFILLPAMICFKDSSFATELFFIFIVFTTFNFKDNFCNYSGLAYSGIAGVLAFFIKISYGIFTIPLLLLVGLFALIKNRKGFAVLIAASGLVFTGIYLSVHIDLLNYVKNSIPVIMCYDEAMAIEIEPMHLEFISAVAFIFLFAAIIAS
jgi:hypothetical protein